MPDLFRTLAVLACPIGMGAMMWFMMRGDKKAPVAHTVDTDSELSGLRAELDQLRAEQRDHTAASNVRPAP